MHMYYKAEMVIDTINHFISKGRHVITARSIKKFNEIENSDRSLNCFIWRNLEVLEKKGILKQIKEKPIRKYLLPKNPIEFSEVKLECY